jgi:uncharacterized protein YuzB (UPF0349 family)
MDGNPLDLLPAVPYATVGTYPFAVAVADVNGDGIPDIVSLSCCTTDLIGTLLGNGDGTFQPAIIGGQGGYLPIALAVADLNGDGKADVVTLSWVTSSVFVHLANGDGTFQDPVSYDSGGINARTVVIADVNGDGIPDLVVGNDAGPDVGNASVAVLLGNGDGTFQAPSSYDTDGTSDFSLAVGDLNGDGKPDLAVVNTCAAGSDCKYGSLAVLLNNGDGTFQSPVIYDTGASSPTTVAIGDVNNDGKPDLLVVNGNGTVGVLLGNGDGTFQTAVTFLAAGGGLWLADLNGDGNLDVVETIGCGDGNRCSYGLLAVLLGNGDGGFQSAVTFQSGGAKASAVAIADLNDDGWPDVVVVNTNGSVGVLLNNSGPHAPTTTTLVSSLNPAPSHSEVTYTATVTSQNGGAVTGTVAFHDGRKAVATVRVASNQAAYSTTYTKGGVHSITAAYSGDLLNDGSSAGLTEYVQIPSKTALATSASPSHLGQPAMFTANVTSRFGAIPDGELVTFYDGTTFIGTGITAGGAATFTTSSLTIGKHTIEAAYGGDDTFEPSSGSVTQRVDKDPTTTALSSSLNPSNYGQAVTFTATVTSAGPNTPTGEVEFKNGIKFMGSATLSGGVATLTTSKLAVGTDSITAKYLGDADSAEGTSSALDQVVE